VEYLMWLLATSGVLQSQALPPAAPESTVAAARATALPTTAPGLSPLAVPAAPTVAAAVVPVSLDITAAPTGVPDSASSVLLGRVLARPWPRWNPAPFGAGSDAPQRPRAVEMSEAYHVRLTIHYIASFAIVPLFVTQYLLGTKLYNDPPGSLGTRQAHTAVALGVATLFTVNGVTGVWNLWDSRKAPQGRLRRYLHAGLMLAAEGGFVATGLAAPRGDRIFTATPADRRRHRALALASMGTALTSYALMLVWRD
jgi:hypothetical protein